MKTIVLGIFDELGDARRVLSELAASPLDLDAVEVVHEDVATQHSLASEVGLPVRRAVAISALGGALAGGLGGWLIGETFLPMLGPLLAMAAGSLVGFIAGAVLGAIAETVRVPEVHRHELERAIAEGATAIVVRTDNPPTARAIGQLFQVGGSRELSQLADEEDESLMVEPDLALFAPPNADSPTDDLGAAADQPTQTTAASLGDPGTPSNAAPAGEGLFAPPWRRGAGAQPAVSPPTEPTMEFNAPALGTEASLVDSSTWEPGALFERAERESTSRRPTTNDGATDPKSELNEAANMYPADATPIDSLGLGPRIAGALERADITTLGQLRELVAKDAAALEALPGIGPVAVGVIRSRLASIGGRGEGVRVRESTRVPRSAPVRPGRSDIAAMMLDAIRNVMADEADEAAKAARGGSGKGSSRR